MFDSMPVEPGPVRRGLARAGALALSALLIMAPQLCRAGRPLATDDAGVVEAGKCEFETYQSRLTGDAASADQRATLRSGQFSCGVTADTQLAVAVAHVSASAGAVYGVLGKTALASLSSQHMHIAIAYAVAGAPQPQRGHLRYAGSDVRAVLTVPHEQWLFHANLGWARAQAPRLDRLVWNLAAERSAALGPVDLMAEVFGDNHSAPWTQLAARWTLLPGRLSVDGAWGRQAQRNHATQASVGLRFTF